MESLKLENNAILQAHAAPHVLSLLQLLYAVLLLVLAMLLKPALDHHSHALLINRATLPHASALDKASLILQWDIIVTTTEDTTSAYQVPGLLSHLRALVPLELLADATQEWSAHVEEADHLVSSLLPLDPQLKLAKYSLELAYSCILLLHLVQQEE